MLLLLATLLAPAPAAPLAPPACITMNTKNLPLATRKSPLDSLSFTVGKAVRVPMWALERLAKGTTKPPFPEVDSDELVPVDS